MVELEQYKFTVNQYKEPMKELGVSLALSHKHEQIKELESEMREEGFWNDPDKAQEVTRKVKNLKDTVSAYHALELTLDDVSTMIDLGNEENDDSVIPDIEELLGEFEIEFDLSRSKERMDHVGHCTNAVQAIERVQSLRAVGHADGDAVALFDAHGEKGLSRLVDLLHKLCEGRLFAHEFIGRQLRIALCCGLDHLIDGLLRIRQMLRHIAVIL